MKVMIGNAWCDENGRSTGGKPGDQKQKGTPDLYTGEVRMQDFYMNKKGWLILRFKKPKYAKKAAKLMKKACNNASLGYSQSDGENGRESVFKYEIASTVPRNCDCSTLVNKVIREATGKDIPVFYTGNEEEILQKTGLFKPTIEYKPGTTLYDGDVIVTKTKGHTAMITEGMPWNNPFEPPKTNVTSSANAKKQGCASYISKGEGVKWVQYELAQHQYQTEIDDCGGIDGDCGKGTVQCIKEYQKLVGLSADGICGPLTIEKLLEG